MDTKRGKSIENMKNPRIGANMEPKKPRANPIRKSVKAGLWLPVSRVHRDMKRECAKRIQTKASIYLTASLEYLCAEILEMSGRAAKHFKRKRITARHLQLVIRSDEELKRLLATVTIPHEPVLRRKGKSKKTKSPQPKKSNQLTINGD